MGAVQARYARPGVSDQQPRGHDPLHRQAGREAAESVGDPGRLLHGEDPTSTFPDDARHWRSVYTELLAFKHEVLELTRARVAAASDGAREELLGTDIPLLEAEAQRLIVRRDFWGRRLAELESR